MSDIKIDCSYDELVPIEKLVPHPLNRNNHPKDQLERLAKIIKETKWRHAITVSKRSGFITTGHGRLEVAKLLGMKSVPVDFQDYESEALEYQHLIADNEIARWAEFDQKGFTKDLELGEFKIDVDLFGIQDLEIPTEALEPQTDEDAVPEVEHPITRRGDIWLLGNHRVMCGDSTMIDDVEKLMNGEKADMVFTDPPYGMNLDADYSGMDSKFKGSEGGNKYENVKGDHADFSNDFINNIFGCFSYCKEIFLWGADYYADLLEGKNEGSWVVWDKRLQESSDKMYGSCFELCWSKSKHKRELARIKWAGIFGMETQDTKKRCHPTQKPIQLTEWFFEKWGKNCNTVADLFLGSGSTLIACEKTNRKCYGMELDEKYCDVIINRWQDYTGKTAALESTGQTYEELKVERLC